MKSDGVLPLNDLTRAKTCAFRFLKIRSRSEKELKDKFIQRKFTPEISAQTIQYLKKNALINDRQFARDWINRWLKNPLVFGGFFLS